MGHIQIAAKQGRYLGTLSTVASTDAASARGGSCEDSGGPSPTSSSNMGITSRKFLWNLYAQTIRQIIRYDPTDSWTHAGATVTEINSAACSCWKHEYICGIAGMAVKSSINGIGANSSFAHAAISFDTDPLSINWSRTTVANTVVGQFQYLAAESAYTSPQGYHVITGVETTASTGTTTYYGDAGGAIATGGVYAYGAGMITTFFGM